MREMLAQVLDECGLVPGAGGKGVADKKVDVFPKQDSVAVGCAGSMFVLPFNGELGQPIGEFRGFRASPDVPVLTKPERATRTLAASGDSSA